MADQEVLREFLVRIGYDVDKKGEDRFVNGVQNITELVRRLGLAVTAAAGTLGVLTVRMAHNLEGLYYSARRVGSSADAIRAFTFAVSQMGGTAEEAQSSLENLQRAMRDNPGVRGMVQQLVGPGVNTQDGAATIRALGARFRNMERHVARQYANNLGIDERTFDALLQDTDRFERRYRELAQRMGVDLNQASGQARTFGQAWREIMLIADLALAKLMPALERIAPVLADGALKLVEFLERLIPKIDEFIRNTVGWENALIILGGALTLHLLGPLGKVIAGFTALAAFRLPVWLLRALGITGVAATGGTAALLLAPGSTNEGEQEALERARRGEDPMPHLPPIQRREDGSVIRPPSAADQLRGWWSERTLTQEQRQLGTQAMEFFQQAGLSAQQAAGIVANLQHESSLNSQAFNRAGGGNGAFGLAQWRGDRQVALGQFVSGRRGQPTDFRQSTFEEQLAFVLHELREGTDRGAREAYRRMQGARNPAEAADIFTRFYERPEAAKVDRLARVRGQTAERWFSGTARPTAVASTAGVTVTNNTQITVNGASTPEAVAARVGEEQRGVNADLVRNLETATR